MNHRQLVFQPMPGFTLITGSLLLKLCPYFQSVQFKLFAALEWILRFDLVKNSTNMPFTNSTAMPFLHLLHPSLLVDLLSLMEYICLILSYFKRCLTVYYQDLLYLPDW